MVAQDEAVSAPAEAGSAPDNPDQVGEFAVRQGNTLSFMLFVPRPPCVMQFLCANCFVFVGSVPEARDQAYAQLDAQHALIIRAIAISAGPACGKGSHGGTRKD